MTVAVNPRDARQIRRLLAGQDLDGELDVVSPPLREVATHLARLPPEGRSAAWQASLSLLDDPGAWVRALAAVDLYAPAPEADEAAAVARFRARLTCAADVEPREVEWLWEGRVPLGMLSLFAGDPKLGKSFVTLGLAAAVSLGAPMPGDTTTRSGPGSVVLLSAEDDPARTIVPRLKSAGADLTRVHILEAILLDDGTEAHPNLRVDLDTIEQAAERVGDCRLVIVDPVSAYLGGSDDHKNSELRGLLSPLKALAERRNLAVVLVTHLNKAAGTNAKYRVTGSIAYVGACRANFLFVKDKDDPTGRRVLFLAAGCNLGPEPPGLAYRVEDHGQGPVVCWEAEPLDIRVEDALAAAKDDKDRGEHRECDEWLRGTLANGPVAQSDIVAAGKEVGLNLAALNKSKLRIGALSLRMGYGKGSKWLWNLPKKAAGAGPPPIRVVRIDSGSPP